MSKKKLCFVISPIGEPDSSIRRDADDLLDLIIRPALEKYDFEVLRGDHRIEESSIDQDVIKMVQSADLCVADISMPNANVWYEVGRRDETGKEIVLLKNSTSQLDVVDLAGRRFISYNLDDRRGIRDAIKQLTNFVENLEENGGLDGAKVGSNLNDIAVSIQRLERKIDALTKNGNAVSGSTATIDFSTDQPTDDISKAIRKSPLEVLYYALEQDNIPLIDRCLDVLESRTDRNKFLTLAMACASSGSVKAGNLLLENALAFMDSSDNAFERKIEYYGCLVGFLNRQDLELENLNLIESLAEILKGISEGENDDKIAQIYNQLNRLYHGIYSSTDERKYLEMAIQNLRMVIKLVPYEGYGYYNLATCLRHFDDQQSLDEAFECICKCIEYDKKPDVDHLKLACKLAKKRGDFRFDTWYETLKKMNPFVALAIDRMAD